MQKMCEKIICNAKNGHEKVIGQKDSNAMQKMCEQIDSYGDFYAIKIMCEKVQLVRFISNAMQKNVLSL